MLFYESLVLLELGISCCALKFEELSKAPSLLIGAKLCIEQ